jgi:hypothetical protein
MVIFKDGSIYPCPEYLIDKARTLVTDCPAGSLYGCPVPIPQVVNFALHGKCLVFVLPRDILNFPFVLMNTEARLTAACQYEAAPMDFSAVFHGKLAPAAADQANYAALNQFIALHPDAVDDSSSVLVTLAIDRFEYNGFFPEVGSFKEPDLEVLTPEPPRAQFPELPRRINSRCTLAIVRVAREHLQEAPPTHVATLSRVDSWGVLIRANEGIYTRFLRLDFDEEAGSQAQAEPKLLDVLTPGYRRRQCEQLLRETAACRRSRQV